MDAFAQDFDLSLSNDEELIAVLTFGNQLIFQRHLFRAKLICHPRGDGSRQTREKGNAAEGIRRQRRITVQQFDGDTFGLAEFNLGTIDAVSSTFDVDPRQQAQQPSRCDRHHLRRRLGGIHKIACDRCGYAPLQEII